MNILEKEIEDIVFESNNEELKRRGLYLYGNKFRQVNLGSYGIADIVCLRIYYNGYWNISVQVVELKKEIIDANTLMQAARYGKGIKEMISKAYNIKKEIDLSYILIGKSIQLNGDFVYLLDDISNVSAYTVHIDLIKGVKFQRERRYAISDGILGCPTKIQAIEIKKMVFDAKNEHLMFLQESENNG